MSSLRASSKADRAAENQWIACHAALLFAYHHRKDEPRVLVRGVSHHLYVKGRYEDALELRPDSESLEEHWSAINSFAWPVDSRNVNELFVNIVKSLNLDLPDGMQDFHGNEQFFVETLAKHFSARRLSPCLYTSVREKNEKDLKLAIDFVSLWNRLDWSSLPHKLVLTIAVITPDVEHFISKYQSTATNCEPVGLISADCLDEWIQGFLLNRLKIDNLPTKPPWWKTVWDFEPAVDTALRFADVKQALKL